MKTIIETQFTCADCGQTFPIKHEGGTGYAILSDGKKVCYACADKREVAALKDRSHPFYGYISSDGKRITTWTGGKLMDITRSASCRLTRQSFTHDRDSYMSVHAVDVHGGHWAGRSSAGIVVKLRPVKSH